jgi:hypothetical protein
MRRGLIFLAILALLLSAVATVRAGRQKKTAKGSISGTVIGPDDKPAPHAAVTYQSSSGNAPHATHADVHGHFTIGNLKGDNYDLRASAKGIFSEWEKNIVVRPGQQKTITLRLIYAKEMPSVTGAPAKKKQ